MVTWTPPPGCRDLLRVLDADLPAWSVLTAGSPAVRERLLDPTDRFDVQDTEDILLGVLPEITGRPLEEILHLFGHARADWSRFHAEILLAGHTLDTLPLGAFLDVVHHLCTKGMDEQQRMRFEGDLRLPVPGMTPTQGLWDDDATGASFAAVMGAMGAAL